MVVSFWRDKKNLTILSTCTTQAGQQIQRKQMDGTVKQVGCSIVVKLYNTHINGVDHTDQLRATDLFNICLYCQCIHYDAWTTKPYEQKHNLSSTRNWHISCFVYLIPEKGSVKSSWSSHNMFNAQSETMYTMHKKGIRREPLTGCEQCEINLCNDCFKSYHLENFQIYR